MDNSRRHFIRLTTAGLLHVSARPFAFAAEHDQPDLLRRAAQRGHTDLGWLQSYHTFSFGRYYDQRHLGFRSLRVINDDRITPGRGFPTHPHRDMEILSYVLNGELQHRDSTGKGSVVRPDDIQIMSAGSGITHSEYNPSTTQANHFLQIWIQPAQRALRPRYQQQHATQAEKRNRLRLIASPDPNPAAVTINQNTHVYATSLQSGHALKYQVASGRHAWLHVATGSLQVNGTTLHAGDAIATSRRSELHLTGIDQADALLFDLG